MRAAFIPALPPSALLAGMIAPSFRLVNRFCGKKLLRTCGRHERPPALCAVWAGSPLAYVKGSLPFDRSLWHRPSLRRTEAARAFRAPIWRKKRGMFHPAPTAAGPPARTSRRVVWRGPQTPPSVFRIQRHARWIRQPCASKATLRRPPPGEAGGKAAGEVGGRRTPVGNDRRQPSFSDALRAVCRSSPRCPR